MRNLDDGVNRGTWRLFARWVRGRRSAVSRQRRLRPAERVSAAFQDPTLVLFHPTTGVMFMSNHVGARIWERITSGQSVAAVTAGLSEEYGLDADTAGRDVERFVDELLDKRLLCEDTWP